MDFTTLILDGIRLLIIGAVIALFLAVIATVLQVLRVQVRSNGIKISNIIGMAAVMVMAPIVIAFYPAIILSSVEVSIENSRDSADNISTDLSGWVEDAFDFTGNPSNLVVNPEPGTPWPTPIIRTEGPVLDVQNTPQAGGGVPTEAMNTAVPLVITVRPTLIPVKIENPLPTPTLRPTATPIPTISSDDWKPGDLPPTPSYGD